MKVIMSFACIRVPALVAGCLMLLQGGVNADERKYTLGDLRLFMSSAERQDIDQPALISDVTPEVELPVVEVIVKKAKLPDSKVSLHGVVVRPDGSATLFLNSGTRNLDPEQRSRSDRFSFPIVVNKKQVILKPGQTVSVDNSSD